jgi:hypothetical protein
MTADATEPVLGVSARYAEQIRDFIEARARERQAAREEAVRAAALADERALRLEEASSRAAQEAVRIDIRPASIPAPQPLEAAPVPAEPARAPASAPASATTPTQALVEAIRPGALLDTQA